MKTVRSGPVTIFPREHGILDVFTGRGWDQHSVFRFNRGNPRLLEGAPLSEHDYSILKEQLKCESDM